ncbi:MAG: glycine oxidase ThiO [Isosphaeraceae bacterium]|nr:glycine oxidase ThiO [Isosphaeraceae bacterium]
MPLTDVVIVGGGVIGLSTAYVLTREGVRTTVLDRRELGREASWAGAGMIAPTSEHVSVHPTVALRSWSARLFSDWSAALLAETGIDNGYRRSGGVDVACNRDEAEALRAAAGRWRAEGVEFERLAYDDIRRVEPALSPSIEVAYYLPDRAQVRNPWHLRALSAAIEGRDATLTPHRAVKGFETSGSRVTAVVTDQGPLPCDCVVVAAGAWSAGVLAELAVTAPTPPVKGQIVLLRPDRPVLKRVVERGSNYLVPRDDGRILVGATEEHVGFDTNVTAQGVLGLLAEALQLCPGLSGATVERCWAGLRPGSIDTRPYIGYAPGFENVIVATGHKRAGLQLSPATAEVVGDLVLRRPPRLDLSPFEVGRQPGQTGDDSFRS